ncbi:MAG: hypothetical protein KJ915_04165 [Candidatus Omnitrophica bacterium]|nr:hypothetical protein [Candidatus Omnitrophota bacterium]
MDDDLFDEFLEYDVLMGGDIISCPYCSEEVACSLFFEDQAQCPKCGKLIKK